MIYRLHDQKIAREIAVELLKIGAIKLQPRDPFTWSSGWKSPIYCDNRVSLSHPGLRSTIRDYLSEIVTKNFEAVNGVAGVATAGIPQGALVADKLALPFVYVRSKPKGHGMENLIEGRLQDNQSLAVVEDLISTGGSSLKAVEALRAEGAEVQVLLSIFNYGFELAEKNCREANVNTVYLSDYEALLPAALEMGTVSQDDIRSLEAWREDPGSWSGA